jgi:hypothetical protein
VAHDIFDLCGYIVLVGQQVGWQAGETLLTLGAKEAAGMVLLCLAFSGNLVCSFALAWAAAMPMKSAATLAALAEDIGSRCIL